MSAGSPIEQVERLRQSVLHWLGLDFDESKQGFLSEILRMRLKETGLGAEAYLSALETADRPRNELRQLALGLTVTETSFFRNPDQFRAFSEVAVPDRIAARSAFRRLRILSAGCASGEEAYSLAACLEDIPGLEGWDISIRGVDINAKALKKAASARYSSWSLRQTSAEVRARLFRMSGRDFVLDESVRGKVTFEEANLVDDNAALWQAESFDIIFCRNVLMYFPPAVARAVIDRMAHNLTPGGFLFLGHAETLRGLSTDFDLRHSHGTFYYQRNDHRAQSHAIRRRRPAGGKALAPAGASIMLQGSWFDTIHNAAQRVRLLTEAPKTAQLRHSARSLPAAVAWAQIDLGLAIDLLGHERFSDVQILLNALPPDRANDPQVLLLNAVLQTHGGNLAAAEKICMQLLALNDTNAGAHYLMALCRESARDDHGAASHDRMAAYLDPSFAMPRLHLGLLARRAGDRLTARTELRQALLLLQREDRAHVILFGGGFSRSALMTLCRAEIATCGGTA